MSDVQAMSETHAPGAGRAWIGFLSAALLLNALSALMIGYTNADRFFDGIWKSFPWSKGQCGDLWSRTAFVLFFVVAAFATVSAYLAVRRSRASGDVALLVSRALFWGGAAQLGYWVLAAVANFGASCSA